MDSSLISIAEILLYQLVDLIPNIVLAFSAFAGEVRLSLKKNIALCCLLYSAVATCRVISALAPETAPVLSVLWVLIYLAFFRFCIRAKLSKLLFVLLTLLNYGSFIIIIETFFSFHVFGSIASLPYSSVSSLVSIVILILTYPSMYLLFAKKLRPLMEYSENTKIWNFLWLIPAIFCLSYYYSLFSTDSMIDYAGKTNNVIFAVSYNIGALFVTYLILRLVEDSNAKLRLEADSYQFSLQALQYKNLKAQMDDARRARHDLRHTVNVLQTYLQDENKNALKEYILQYLDSLPPDKASLYSDDYILNALISTYQEKAQKENIKFHVGVQLEGILPLPEPDKVVLLGNLLENAVEACRRLNSENAYISLAIHQEGPAFVILLDNSHSGILKKEEQVFLSSKDKPSGLGISSIQKITEKHHGILKLEHDDTGFHSSVMLFPEQVE